MKGSWVRCRDRGLSVLLLLTSGFLTSSVSGQEGQSSAEAFDVAGGTWNSGLSGPIDRRSLETPWATLDNLIGSVHEGDLDRAAWSLDLSGLPDEEQAERGPELARKLVEVMDREVWVDWNRLSDRPDGRVDRPSLKQQASGSSASGPHRSILLGAVSLEGRDRDIRLRRIAPEQGAPVWVISPRTVGYVEPLHRVYGPSRFERWLPEPLTEHDFLGIEVWQWLGLFVFLGLGVAIGFGLELLIERILMTSLPDRFKPYAGTVRIPLTIAVGLLIFQQLTSHFLRLGGPVLGVLEPILLVVVSLAIVWTIHRLVSTIAERFRNRLADEPGHSAMITQISVAKQIVSALVLVIGICLTLSQFQWFQWMGLTLLGSAGIAGLVLGVAAQRTLSNLIAGIQLALTKPVVVGDAVVFEGQWGYVEEIAMTYLVIRTWDLRRFVVPLNYLIDRPIENWSKYSEALIKPVYVKVDYRTDVGAVRKHFDEILRDNPLWDEQTEPKLQVVDTGETTMTLRALCSARDSSEAWDLHCQVREALLDYLAERADGRDLPRRRLELEPSEALYELASSSSESPDGATSNRSGGDRKDENDRKSSKGGSNRNQSGPKRRKASQGSE